MVQASRAPSQGRHSLTIAGFDPSGGAGVLRDIEELNATGSSRQCLAAITALTVQDGTRYEGHEPVAPELLARQLGLLAGSYDIGFVKIGMLATRPTVEVVASFLDTLKAPIVVLDPVLGASAGGALLDDEGLTALREQLLPKVSVITPNAPELRRLLGDAQALPGPALSDLEAWLGDAREALGVDVLLTGGHLPPPLLGTDLLATAAGVMPFPPERVASHGAHGTGCTFSSALLYGRALGMDWHGASRYAKGRVLEWIESEQGRCQGRAP